MDQEQLVKHFATTNSIGLQSHGGDVDAWAQGQMTLLNDEVKGLRARLTQCRDGVEAHEDAQELAQSAIFRRKLLLAFIRSTQETLHGTEHASKLVEWIVEVGDMKEPSGFAA